MSLVLGQLVNELIQLQPPSPLPTDGPVQLPPSSPTHSQWTRPPLTSLPPQPVDPSDTRFWDQFWSESVASVEDVFAQTPAADIRALREEMPANMATVCFKAVEKLLKASETGCSTQQEQQTGGE